MQVFLKCGRRPQSCAKTVILWNVNILDMSQMPFTYCHLEYSEKNAAKFNTLNFETKFFFHAIFCIEIMNRFFHTWEKEVDIKS